MKIGSNEWKENIECIDKWPDWHYWIHILFWIVWKKKVNQIGGNQLTGYLGAKGRYDGIF